MKYQYLDEKGEHLHTLDSKPIFGTSTIVSETIAKNLTWWSAELSAVECLEAGEKIETIREEYLEAKKIGKAGIDALQVKYPIFKKARFAHRTTLKDKAQKGTDLHEELEHFIRAEMGKQPHRDYDPKIQPFIEWAKENVEEFIWSEANCFSERLWCGGISDCGAKLKDGKLAIIDFKSAKEPYPSHFIQIAGYAIQVEENGIWDASGTHNKLVDKVEAFIVVPFGGDVKPVIRYDVEELKKGFESCLTIYKLIK